jgi:hypothetical protein
MELDKGNKISSFAILVHVFCLHWEVGYDPHSFHYICDVGSLEDRPSSLAPFSHDISNLEDDFSCDENKGSMSCFPFQNFESSASSFSDLEEEIVEDEPLNEYLFNEDKGLICHSWDIHCWALYGDPIYGTNGDNSRDGNVEIVTLE